MVIGMMEFVRDKVSLHYQMDMFIKETGYRMKIQEKENKNIRIQRFTKEIL